MRVKSDFEWIYETHDDPWAIGDADSERYETYYEFLRSGIRATGSILDIGSGMGAFLARFADLFDSLTGVEVTRRGVERGRERFPSIDFHQGSADRLEEALPDAGRFDAIVYSDVIYYLRDAGRHRSLRWIADHLSGDGVAFIAAYAPGGRYLDQRELVRLVERYFRIDREQVLVDSEHVMILARRKRRLAALTIDYETWHPLPPGREIDWDRDVFMPTDRLLEACRRTGAKLTIMAEVGEHLWLRERQPEVAARMEEQWRAAAADGHDVQLHLHPNWLPEVAGDTPVWEDPIAPADSYPGDLTELIGRCRSTIETALAGAAPPVTAFRAGGYEAQPFERLHRALVENGIACDSSVLPGSSRPDRGYDYALAYSDHQPYFAARTDPQLLAPPAEDAVLELPVFVHAPGERWTFDAEEGGRFADRLQRRVAERRMRSTEAYRRRRRLRDRVRRAYGRLPERARAVFNRIIPRRLAHAMAPYEPERSAGDDYFVLVGHSKSDLVLGEVEEGMRRLVDDGRFELVTLSEMADRARADVAATAARERGRLTGPAPARPSSAEHSSRLAAWVPLDRSDVLQLDPEADLGSGPFDCVVVDGWLERRADPDRALAALRDSLSDDGCLVAAIYSDARAPRRANPLHVWKTAPHDVHTRLRRAGFGDVELDEVDAYRELGMEPYPPSRDRIMYVRAWKRESGAARAAALTRWAYERLDPERPQVSDHDPLAVLADGHAWCWGYVLVLGEALRREGYEPAYVTMVAEDHPRGRGPTRRDSHEVIEVVDRDGARRVLDPMAGVVFDHAVVDLLRDPALADVERAVDERYRERGYELYATSEWYRRVVEAAVRDRPGRRLRLAPVDRLTGDPA